MVKFYIDNHLVFEPDTHRYISVGYSRITTNRLSSPRAQKIFSLTEVKELVRHNFDKVSQNLTLQLAAPAEEVDPGNLI